MVYNSTYDTQDLTEMAIDGFGISLLEVISMIGLIVLVLIFAYLVKLVKKIRR